MIDIKELIREIKLSDKLRLTGEYAGLKRAEIVIEYNGEEFLITIEHDKEVLTANDNHTKRIRND